MRIGLLSYEYPPETGFGGIGTYTWYQARALVKLGHQVDVISGASEPMPLNCVEKDGVSVFRYRRNGLLMKGFRTLDRVRLWWTKNRLENAFSMFDAYQTLSQERAYDLVEMPECGAEGLLINYFKKCPVVVRFHSPSRLIMPYYDVRKLDTVVCSFLEQRGIRNATNFSACSNFLAKEATSRLNVGSRIHVIPNGIDLDLFDATVESDVYRNFEIPMDRPVIFFSGRMEPRKGVHLLREIVPSILERYEVSFVMAGQDLFHHMRDSLLPYWQTKKLKGSFHYLGRLNQNDVRTCLLHADIFLLPSLWENCPYSCLEAMAARCAIVSTDHGGMPEIIEDRCNGLLARNGEAASYVSGLQSLIEDHALRERLAEAGRRTIEQSFTDTRIATLSADFYSQCVYGNGQPSAEYVQPV